MVTGSSLRWSCGPNSVVLEGAEGRGRLVPAAPAGREPADLDQVVPALAQPRGAKGGDQKGVAAGAVTVGRGVNRENGGPLVPAVKGLRRGRDVKMEARPGGATAMLTVVVVLPKGLVRRRDPVVAVPVGSVDHPIQRRWLIAGWSSMPTTMESSLATS